MQHFPDLGRPNIQKYCARAVEKGLVTVEVVPCKYGATNVYKAIQDWDTVVEFNNVKPKPKPARVRSQWQGVNSVFSIAA
jgi:hypothetical protein